MRRIPSLILVGVCFASFSQAGQTSAPATSETRRSLQHGILLLEQKRYEEARREFARVTEGHPASAEAFFYLGMAEAKLGHLLQSEKSLRHSLELNPRSVNSLYNLAVLWLEQKRTREAIPYLERASQLGLQDPEVAVNLIRAYLDSL
jgi:Flp pilus assembly protein TadD